MTHLPISAPRTEGPAATPDHVECIVDGMLHVKLLVEGPAFALVP